MGVSHGKSRLQTGKWSNISHDHDDPLPHPPPSENKLRHLIGAVTVTKLRIEPHTKKTCAHARSHPNSNYQNAYVRACVRVCVRARALKEGTSPNEYANRYYPVAVDRLLAL